MRLVSMSITALFCAFLALLPAYGEQRVDPLHTHERLMAIVPMIGTGTAADPIRPMYTPLPGSEEAKQILAFSYVVSDDGKSALVEFVARDADAFESMLNDKRADARTWLKRGSSRNDVAKEFRKLRKDFDMSSFGARAR